MRFRILSVIVSWGPMMYHLRFRCALLLTVCVTLPQSVMAEGRTDINALRKALVALRNELRQIIVFATEFIRELSVRCDNCDS